MITPYSTTAAHEHALFIPSTGLPSRNVLRTVLPSAMKASTSLKKCINENL
jgi:hypothetical protein